MIWRKNSNDEATKGKKNGDNARNLIHNTAHIHSSGDRTLTKITTPQLKPKNGNNAKITHQNHDLK